MTIVTFPAAVVVVAFIATTFVGEAIECGGGAADEAEEEEDSEGDCGMRNSETPLVCVWV